jgi:hypothetical protein
MQGTDEITLYRATEEISTAWLNAAMVDEIDSDVRLITNLLFNLG